MSTTSRTRLQGINFHVHGISMPHRKSLISLLKIEFDDFRPIYSKINPRFIRLLATSQSRKVPICEPSKEDTEEFGIFNMFEVKDTSSSSPKVESTSSSTHTISVELYSDRSELEIICAGRLMINNFHTINESIENVSSMARRRNPLFKSDPVMNCCNFTTLTQISDKFATVPYNLTKKRAFTSEELVGFERIFPSLEGSTAGFNEASSVLHIPLYYKTQGRFAIEAGYLSVSIRLYSVDMELLQSQIALVNPDKHVCPRCDGLAPVVREESDDSVDYRDKSFQTQTTNEEEESRSDSIDSALLNDDHDSVDEFIETFNRRNSILSKEYSTVTPHLLAQQLPEENLQVEVPVVSQQRRIVPSKKKRKVTQKKRTRNFVYENTIFPKPRQPSRAENLRYLKFK